MENKLTTKEWDNYCRDTARAWLSRCSHVYREYKFLCSEYLAEINYRNPLASADLSGMPHPPRNSGDDKILNMIISSEKRANKILSAMSPKREVLEDCEKRLVQLTSHRLAAGILWKHYVEGVKYSTIASTHRYTEPYLRAIARDALLELYDLMPPSERTTIQQAI